MGLLYYEMLYGKRAWMANSQYELYKKIEEGIPDYTASDVS